MVVDVICMSFQKMKHGVERMRYGNDGEVERCLMNEISMLSQESHLPYTNS